MGVTDFHGNKNEDLIKRMTRTWKNVECVNIGIDNFTNIEHSEYMELMIFGEK
jgi:hypothetical protein